LTDGISNETYVPELLNLAATSIIQRAAIGKNMNQPSLGHLLMPATIGVVGASDTPGKVGFTVLQNLLKGGFSGELFPINSLRDSVQGLQAYRTIADVPAPLDLVIICTPAASVPSLVRECGAKGVSALLILTAGFRELGEAGAHLQEQVQVEQRKFPGMRIVGPNCLGMICPWSRMNASFAVGMPDPGSVAFLSQSGALCTAVLDWALSEGIGFSHFISLGNQLDVGFADLLEELADDPRTTAAILYIESISNARHFLAAARKFARSKPIIAYKAGRFAESAKAAASHTGAMAGVDAVYEAAFERAGIVRVSDMESMFQCAELLTQHPQPVGPRLAIVTNAGGPGVMAVDALLAERGHLAQLSESTLQTLNGLLPRSWSHGNPVDVLGDADEHRFASAAAVVLSDPNVDTLLAVLTPQSMTNPTQTAALLSQVVCPPGKTILASWMGGEQMREGRHRLHAARIPNFNTPEQAIRGLSLLIAYAKARARLNESSSDVCATSRSRNASNGQLQRIEHGREILEKQRGAKPTMLSQFDSKSLLSKYEIPATPIMIATSAQQAVDAATAMGFPVVLKIHSPQISHKTEVDGVVLNLKDAAQVSDSFYSLVTRAKQLRPDAEILGATVEPMISLVNGVELILGAKRDPIFGSVVMVGFGGVAAELFQDRALNLPPVDCKSALRMLQSLRCWPLLSGYRGKPSMNVEQIAQLIVRFSELIVEQPDILEADINPLLVSPGSIVALDARFLVASAADTATQPYSHLAILPDTLPINQS
jgi:acetyltransferase